MTITSRGLMSTANISAMSPYEKRISIPAPAVSVLASASYATI
jgi:hypothetical protein